MDEENQLETDVENCQTNPSNLLHSLINLVDRNEIESIINSQRQILTRFEKTNEMLVNCNLLAQTRFNFVAKDLKTYKQQLNSMKKELDQIYVKLKTIKQKVSKQCGEQYQSAKNRQSIEEDKEED